MIRRTLSTLAILAFVSTPLLAQQAMKHEADHDQKVEGVPMPAGWTGRADGEKKITDTKFFSIGQDFHVTTGPAAIWWNPSQDPKGAYVARATFRQTKAPMHPEAYGLFFVGRNLDAESQSYAYVLVRGDGKVTVKHRAGKEVHTIMDWTENAAVHKQDANGVATNTLTIDASRPDSIRLKVNDVQISAFEKGYMGGGLGHLGLRVNHNLDVHVSDFMIKPSPMK